MKDELEKIKEQFKCVVALVLREIKNKKMSKGGKINRVFGTFGSENNDSQTFINKKI
jgi:hypothetical protein